jgi:excisionase family DNA binding protein
MSAHIEHAAGTQATRADPQGTDIAVLPGSYDPGSGGNEAAPVANGDQTTAIDEVIDVERVARLLQVGRNTVYALVARNAIPHRRLGKQIRFSRAAIMRWLDPWSSQGAKEGQ